MKDCGGKCAPDLRPVKKVQTKTEALQMTWSIDFFFYPKILSPYHVVWDCGLYGECTPNLRPVKKALTKIEFL